MEKAIHSRMIFEILGRPAEHIKEALNTLIVRLGSEKGVNILNKVYHDPKKIENADELYSAFSEVELEIESIDKFFLVIFGYFPSNVEVIAPREIKIRNEDLNSLANDLVARIHHYDAITKKFLTERNILASKLKEMGIEFGSEMPAPDKESKQKDSKRKK